LTKVQRFFGVNFLGFAFVLLLIGTSFEGSSQQNFNINGRVVTKADPLGLPGANVVALSSADSSIVKGTTTDLDGSFLLTGLNPAIYILKVSFVGYQDNFRNVTISNESIDLGVITPTESAIDLKGVEVTEQIHQSTQMGDTTQFNAAAFKTNPDANTEDLIRKMPGITTEGGKVEAQGEEVKQVLIDGKPFFGNDPNAALKNLPADAVDKIQISNYKSDQVLFTGFEDGSEGKTINIITKPEYRNGTFGRLYAGYGDQEKYKAGGNLNFFNDDRRITLLFQGNNINEQNFAADDLSGVLGASGGGRGRPGSRGFGRGTNVNEFLVDQANGVSTVYAAGINYSDQWGKKTKATGSYFFNLSDNVTRSSLFRDFTLGSDEDLFYNQGDTTVSRNQNHRINFRIEHEIDSMNSIIFSPRLTYQLNTGSNIFTGINSGSDSIPFNETSSLFKSEYEAYNISASLLYRRKLAKKGRTLSIDLTPSYNSNIGENSLESNNRFYDEIITTDSLDQRGFLNQMGYNLGGSVAYTEPLGEKSMLQINWRSNYNFSDSDKETFRYSAASDAYDIRDTLLTNIFDNIYHTQSIGPEYRFNNKKIQVNLGVNYQWAELRSVQEFPIDFGVNQQFNAVLPNARITYNFADKKNFRINYRTSNDPPSATQLQEVLNNSNPVRLTIGNADLEQDYQHRIFMRYSSSNTAKSTTFFVGGGMSYTNNYVGNSTIVALNDTTVNGGIFLSRGTQLVKPVNLDGYISFRSFMSYGFPVKFLKSNLNLNGFLRYSRTPGLVNEQTNWSNTPAIGAGFTLSSNISQELDFTVGTRANYNVVINTLQSDLNNSFYSQDSRLTLTWMFWKGFVFSTEVNHQYLSGVSAGFSQNFLLVNGGFGYKFLKKRQAEFRITVFDLLNANESASRTFNDVYTEDVSTNVLQRFFMLTFTYNIRNFKSGN
jgi:hypothetical protein